MNPFKLDDLQIVVVAVRADANGKAKVDWARSLKISSHTTLPRSGADFTLPAGLSGYKDTYILFTATSYLYKPNITFIGSLGERRIDDDNTFRPRKSLEITPPSSWRS